MAKKLAIILGVVFLVVGVVGFAIPNLAGTHLSPAHNVIHLVSGALAIYFGQGSLETARKFCLVFGLVYFLLGVTGFAMGRSGDSNELNIGKLHLEYETKETLWQVIPGTFELGSHDHVLHVVIGLVFFAGGLVGGKIRT